MKTEVIEILRHGGPEVLILAERDLPSPGDLEVLVEQHAIGVNYIDIQHRTGRYPIKDFPTVLGVEAAGIILELGIGVTGLKVGDSVAYIHLPIGSYARHRILPADCLIPIPKSMDLLMVGTTINRALTAQYLVKDSHPVRPGEDILVHAATGGVGQIVVQWAKFLGARVIGTVGSLSKHQAALDIGCDQVILNSASDMVKQVRAASLDGQGVHAVYDGIGGSMFDQSLQCLRPCGKLVSFGTPGGPIPPFDLFRLNQLGSLSVTSPSIFTFIKTRNSLLARSEEVLGLIREGVLRIPTPAFYAFDKASQSHIDLQGRKTQGSVGLVNR